MSRGAEIAGSRTGGDAARDWDAVRAAGDIQFAPLPPPKPELPSEPPAWLKALSEFLRGLFEPLGQALGMSWPVMEKLLIALAVLAALWLLWRVIGPLLAVRRAARPAPEEWAPEREAALALLDDADRLAGEGRFAEAVHLLLQRSVGHIAAARPEWLHPASTAREIAGLPLLPARARQAFAVIAERVERSRFALRALDGGDWSAARSAYADFALADLAAA